ncbi:MAG: peptide-methionine (S)-S-oxide reductase MsrA [Gammaproteobacteria bacterium]|nr:peptide-methionine (S)-S-oxide reductase MsrA [Gammaproteobacteria bacterium]
MTNSPVQVPEQHFVNGNSLSGPFDDHLQQAVFAMGCFWGAERRFWETEGVHSTAVGYTGGAVAHANYQQVCSGDTGHAEVVLVTFDPSHVSYRELLSVFWENHDPTQGMRQGNDIGTQYRSAIFTLTDEQATIARDSLQSYQAKLLSAGLPAITTEVTPLDEFSFAEEYHQQYLAKNPGGYCGLGGTGVSCG